VFRAGDEGDCAGLWHSNDEKDEARTRGAAYHRTDDHRRRLGRVRKDE
jgi:hypothetical protein